MPGMAYGLGKQNPQPNETGFTANLRRLIEQHSGESPSRVAATQQEGQVLVWADFDTRDGAAKALAGLQDSPLARRITAENVAVIEKDAAGKVSLSETEDRSGRQGLKRGVGLGGLLGVFMPALAILPAAASLVAHSASSLGCATPGSTMTNCGKPPSSSSRTPRRWSPWSIQKPP